jgi:myosin-crossreactive antigen
MAYFQMEELKMRFNFNQTIDVEKTNAYMVGAGIASLSAAIFLIRDGHVPGKNIHIERYRWKYGWSRRRGAWLCTSWWKNV